MSADRWEIRRDDTVLWACYCAPGTTPFFLPSLPLDAVMQWFLNGEPYGEPFGPYFPESEASSRG